MKTGYVYIETNFYKTVFYIGVTSDIEQRHNQHKTEAFDGFSKKYKTKYLIWFEEFALITDAIDFEKKLKKWKRKWKIELIEKLNPDWKDLSTGLPFGPI